MVESLIGLAAVLILALLRLPIAFAMGIVGFVGFALKVSWHASFIQGRTHCQRHGAGLRPVGGAALHSDGQSGGAGAAV